MSGNTSGRFVVATDPELNVVMNSTTGVFDFSGLPDREYVALFGAVNSPSQFGGVTSLNDVPAGFDLSNMIRFELINLNGGTISFENLSDPLYGGSIQIEFLEPALGSVTRAAIYSGDWSVRHSFDQAWASFDISDLPAGDYKMVAANTLNFSLLTQVIAPSIIPACIARSNILNFTKSACVAESTLESAPNPANAMSNVTFTLPENDKALLEVYDLNGKLMAEVFAGDADAESDYRFSHNISHLPNGVYLYRLTTSSEVKVAKFVIAHW